MADRPRAAWPSRLSSPDDQRNSARRLISLKPIKYPPPPNKISFPFNQRYLMWFWNALYKPEHRFQPNTATTDARFIRGRDGRRLTASREALKAAPLHHA